MTAPIDDLLARARLLDEADTPYDRVRMDRPGATASPGRRPAAEPAPAAGAGRVPGSLPASDPAVSRRPPAHPAAAAGGGADGTVREAARDLRSLCEAVVTASAVTSLGDCVTRVLPEPPGARVLGCILQLNGAQDSARFWWQYAAGAGDTSASYCLHLHHLSLGERGEASWWQRQASGAAGPVADADDQGGGPEPGFPRDHPPVHTDRSVPTMLRVLSRLKVSEREAGGPARPAVVRVVMEYVASAVSYVDPDLELPLPGADFTDHIRVLTAPVAGRPRPATSLRPLAVRRVTRSDGTAPHAEAG